MTLQEYELKIVSVSIAADNLTAAIGLLNEHYFKDMVKCMGERYWIGAHDQLGKVAMALLTLSAGIRDALEELERADVELGQAVTI